MDYAVYPYNYENRRPVNAQVSWLLRPQVTRLQQRKKQSLLWLAKVGLIEGEIIILCALIPEVV